MGYVARSAAAGDVIIDETDYSPAPPTGIDAALDRRLPVFHAGLPRVQYDPFRVLAEPPPAASVARRAVRAADGARIFVISSESVFAASSPLDVPLSRQVAAALPAGYRAASSRTYPGILSLAVTVYADRASRPG